MLVTKMPRLRWPRYSCLGCRMKFSAML